MHAFWIPSAFALAMTGATVQPIKDQAAGGTIGPNLSDQQTDILDLEAERNHRLTVPVTIDGSGPYNFMVDTGSQATAITHAINDQLDLEHLGTATLIGMASRRSVDLVELEELGLGSRTIYNLTAPILHREHVGADGIIGLDTLQDMRVLIDFRNETIAVADAEEEQSTRGYEIVVRARKKHDQLLITNAEIEGVEATVIIDTGAQASLGNTVLQRRIRAKRQEQITTTDVNGVSMQGDWAIAREMKIQGLLLKNMPIAFADAPAFEALGLQDRPVLSLGMQHLRIFDRIAIDFSKQRVLFDLPSKSRVRRAIRRARATRM